MSEAVLRSIEIAPALMDLAKKCEANGLSLVAHCEFAEGDVRHDRDYEGGRRSDHSVLALHADA